jgi:hypothetical protein
VIVDPARRCAAWEAARAVPPYHLAWFWITAWLPAGGVVQHGGPVWA